MRPPRGATASPARAPENQHPMPPSQMRRRAELRPPVLPEWREVPREARRPRQQKARGQEERQEDSARRIQHPVCRTSSAGSSKSPSAPCFWATPRGAARLACFSPMAPPPWPATRRSLPASTSAIRYPLAYRMSQEKPETQQQQRHRPSQRPPRSNQPYTAPILHPSP